LDERAAAAAHDTVEPVVPGDERQRPDVLLAQGEDVEDPHAQIAVEAGDDETVLAELGDVIGWEEDTAMLAPSAHSDERHLRAHQLTERSADAFVVAVAGGHGG
jgi:hypothetical protein